MRAGEFGSDNVGWLLRATVGGQTKGWRTANYNRHYRPGYLNNTLMCKVYLNVNTNLNLYCGIHKVKIRNTRYIWLSFVINMYNFLNTPSSNEVKIS